MDLRNPPQWERPWAEHYQYGLELAEFAEAAGVDRIGIAEHHFFPDGYIPQPLTFAAAVAARTSRVRIGTSVMIPVLRAPVDVAEQAAVVDLISGGRVELGFGAGYRVPEFKAYGMNVEDRWARFAECVAALREYWSPSGAVTPKPIQNPIPIIGGFSGPRGKRLAGRLGLPLMSLLPDISAYLVGLEEGGHDLRIGRQEGYLHGILVDDPDASLPFLAPYIENFWNVYLREDSRGAGRAGRPDATAEELLAVGPRYPAGFGLLTVEQASSLIFEVADGRPVTNVCFWATIPGIPRELAFRNLELLGQLKGVVAAQSRAPWMPQLTDEMRTSVREAGPKNRRSVFG
jgi:alkanesulfonate monooxygenase SsuD/methylene tetrahydromethanopterin reductase-like flavin-dependent oxidoreductase (luciferase family)